MKNRKGIFFLLFVFSLVSLFSQTTQNVKGKVFDNDSEFPLSGAEVYIKKNNKLYGAVTDFNGEYLIKNVPIGKVDIRVVYNGYREQKFNDLYLEAGKELVVNFYLIEEINKLDKVVIHSHRKRDQVEFSVNSEGLKAKQITRYAGSLEDVSRMAMNYAGVASNDDSRNDIIVRGNNPSSLLWTMEGITIPNPNHYSALGSSGGPVSMINTNTLGKSYFLTGAFPANFGNTTSAAFDLKFRRGNSDKYEFLGQIGFAGAELGAEGPINRKNKSSFLINYRYSTLELFDKIGIDLGISTAVPKYQDVSFIVDIPSKKLGNFRIWSITGKSKIRFLTSDVSDDNVYLDYNNSDLKTYNFTIISGINNKYFFNKKTSLFSSVSYSKLDQRVTMDTLNLISGRFDNFYRDKIITDYLTTKAEVKSKRNVKNTIAVGSEFIFYMLDMFMEVNKQSYTYTNSIRKSTGLSGTYINWQHKFSDKLKLNTGFRFQYFTLNKQFSPEPRLGLMYRINNKTKITFAYGLHSNIQPLLAYFSKHRYPENTYKNLKLKFSKSHHFVLGLERDLGSSVHFKTEFYYQYLFDIPVYHIKDLTYSIINAGYLSPGGTQVYYYPLYNEGKGKNYGVDITLEHPLNKGFYLLFTGSLYQSFYKAYDGKWRNTAWNGNFMTSLLSGKEFAFSDRKFLNIDINFNFSGGRRYTPIDEQASKIVGEAVYEKNHTYEYQLPAYFRADLKISYKLNGKHITQEWQLSLRNLFNRRNIFSQRFDKKSRKIVNTYQTGFLPVFQYRILF